MRLFDGNIAKNTHKRVEEFDAVNPFGLSVVEFRPTCDSPSNSISSTDSVETKRTTRRNDTGSM